MFSTKDYLSTDGCRWQSRALEIHNAGGPMTMQFGA